MLPRVAGPHDMIALVETIDLEALGGFVVISINSFTNWVAW